MVRGPSLLMKSVKVWIYFAQAYHFLKSPLRFEINLGMLIPNTNGQPPLYPGWVFCKTHTTSPKVIGKGLGQKKYMDIDKHSTVAIWERLVVAGAVFFLVHLGPGAPFSGMRIEINTWYSCYLICNNSRHRMALQSITEYNSYSLFSVMLVFVFLHVFVIVFVFPIFTISSMTFSQSCRKNRHSFGLLQKTSQKPGII